ncbi:NF-kappa-B inhibitor zeta [Takifugu flavidus]|uniref:NF-kappa-B inhibitor zeta n=1 Tax=Takifugu flavidus TaxID=433684 RepID=UPI00254465BD|nr:NF-kappa-B inhibitor zeta [Takifugu flavidus]
MLDPSCETGGNRTGSLGASFINDRGHVPAGPGLHRYLLPVPRKNTVRELLTIKRLVHQKHNCFQDRMINNNNLEFQSGFSGPTHLPGPLTPVGGGKRPPVQLTLFQWQIQREEQKVAGMSAEQLSMQDADGDTVLHIAVAQGKRALVYVLAVKMAEHGALDLKEHKGQTALHVAVATNNHLIVQDLLTHGANVNTWDHWGRSPLHVCAQKGHLSSLQAIWKTVQWTRQQVDTGMHNYDGLTALHTATMSHNAVLKELWDQKHPCTDRKTELEQRRQTYANIVKSLLLMGASIGSKDLKSGRTCLHMAAEAANVELLKVFLDPPSSVTVINATAFNGNTALHVVSALQHSRSQTAAVKLLMSRGADPGIRNLENELPWQLVAEGPSGEKVRQLLKGKHLQN